MRGGRPPPSLSWTVNGSAGCDRDDDDDDDEIMMMILMVAMMI